MVRYICTPVLGMCSQTSEAGAVGSGYSTTAFHARVRGSFPVLGGLKETKMFLPHSLVKISRPIVGSLCGQKVGPGLGLTPPGFEFRIVCLEGSVISPSPGGSLGSI